MRKKKPMRRSFCSAVNVLANDIHATPRRLRMAYWKDCLSPMMTHNDSLLQDMTHSQAGLCGSGAIAYYGFLVTEKVGTIHLKYLCSPYSCSYFITTPRAFLFSVPQSGIWLPRSLVGLHITYVLLMWWDNNMPIILCVMTTRWTDRSSSWQDRPRTCCNSTQRTYTERRSVLISI
jgi:hypothetical protein